MIHCMNNLTETCILVDVKPNHIAQSAGVLAGGQGQTEETENKINLKNDIKIFSEHIS